MQPTATTLDPGVIGAQSPSVASARWLQWSTFLLVIYATISVVGWRRTLIDTEVWALFHAGRSFGEFMNAVRGDLVHPPLFYVIEWLWIRAVGHTDTAVKTLAFLINVPSFFLFTWLAARVTRHWRLASFLFFGLYFRIGSTPNQVRMYGLGLLLTIAAMVLWECWHERPSNRSLIAWTFVAVLLVYTHLFGLLTLAGFLVANWLAGPRRRAFTAATVGVALSFLPWLFYVLPVYRSRGLADNLTWVPKQIHVAMGILSYGLLGEVEAAQSSRILFAVLAAAINFAVLLLVLRTATRLWPPTAGAHAGRRWFWVAMTLVAVPILTHLVFAVVERPALHWRFVLGIFPPYWLLLILAFERSGRIERVLLHGIVVPWVTITSLVSIAYRSQISPARQAATVIVSEQRPADLIVVQNLSIGNQLYWELKHRLGHGGRIEVLRPPAAVARLSVLPPTDLENLDLVGIDRVWFFSDNLAGAKRARESLATYGFVSQSEYPEQPSLLLVFVRKASSSQLRLPRATLRKGLSR